MSKMNAIVPDGSAIRMARRTTGFNPYDNHAEVASQYARLARKRGAVPVTSVGAQRMTAQEFRDVLVLLDIPAMIAADFV